MQLGRRIGTLLAGCRARWLAFWEVCIMCMHIFVFLYIYIYICVCNANRHLARYSVIAMVCLFHQPH